jgi:hypothetical protein
VPRREKHKFPLPQIEIQNFVSRSEQELQLYKLLESQMTELEIRNFDFVSR